MSLRLLTTRFFQNGRYILQNYWKRNIHINILEQNQTRTRAQIVKTQSSYLANTLSVSTVRTTSGISQSSGVYRFGEHARKLLIDNILNRVNTNVYVPELRKQATKKLFYGNSGPFLALVGVGLVSGTGVLTKDDELEAVCWEIRETANRLQKNWQSNDEISRDLGSEFNINKLTIGPAIDKGCMAVVYSAALKTQEKVGEFPYYNYGNPISGVSSVETLENNPEPCLKLELQNKEGVNKEVLETSYNLNNDAVTELQSIKIIRSEIDKSEQRKISILEYPLALKMMFNYEIQSNASCILRAMWKETVPARWRCNLQNIDKSWEQYLDQTLVLPPHPNIVCMYGFFCDEVGNFPDGNIMYPCAQPQRINPHGYGRNKSLYLLMKRYDYSLKYYLESNPNLSMRVRLLLFAQLLEAVVHIGRHRIAHRDLKSDNILIELNGKRNKSSPVLVVSDFGCCLADRKYGLQIPFHSLDMDRGGNQALMAPEIMNKQPGPFATLNYCKADLWASGSIAYEIFGMQNPFYSYNNLISRKFDYKSDDLPKLGKKCPLLVRHLIYNLLSPNPSKRLSPDMAANVIQLFLWAPSQWLKSGFLPTSSEILQWLLSLTTKVMCKFRGTGFSFDFGINQTSESNGSDCYVEYSLICSFLVRASLRSIQETLKWIQSVM